MNGVNYLDGDTERQVRQALRDGKTLDYVAGYVHMDTEFLGRLLQLPTTKPAVDGFDLWRVPELDNVL